MSFRLLLAGAVLVAAFVAAAAEIPLSPSDFGPAPGNKFVVAAIGTPDGFLTIRAEGPYLQERLLAARISRDGHVLDPLGIEIGALERSIYERKYDLRADGDRYVFTVTTRFLAVYPDTYDYQTKRITLDANAQVVESTTTVTRSTSWESAANARGERLFIGTRPEHAKVTISFVGSDGVKRNPTPLEADVTSVQSVVPYGDEWLIVAVDHHLRLRWYRMRESTRNAPKRKTIPTGSSDIRDWTVVSSDGHFGVLTERTSIDPYRRHLTLFTITPAGTSREHPLLTNEPVRGFPSFWDLGSTTLAREGDSWLASYRWLDDQQHEQLRMWRVQAKPESRDIDGEPTETRPFIASNPTHNLLVVLRDRDSIDGWGDLYAQVFPHGAWIEPSDPATLLSWNLTLQSQPSAAAGALGILGAWIEDEASIRVRFLGANGGGTAARTISSPAWDGQAPAVARNGETFLVAWQEWRYDHNSDPAHQKVKVMRFDARGIAIDAAPLVLQDMPTAPFRARVTIAPEGDGFRVVWSGRPLAEAHDQLASTIYTTRVPRHDDAFPEPQALVPPSESTSSWNPIVVSNGSELSVFWNEQTTGGPSTAMRGHYRSGAELRGDSSAIAPGAASLAAAANGTEVLLATARPEAGGNGFCTDVHRLSFTGAELGSPVTLECHEGFPESASVVWDGKRWWVTSSADRSNVHLLHADGTLDETRELFDAETNPRSLELFEIPDGGPAAVYVRSDDATKRVDRAFVRAFPRPKGRAVRP